MAETRDADLGSGRLLLLSLLVLQILAIFDVATLDFGEFVLALKTKE